MVYSPRGLGKTFFGLSLAHSLTSSTPGPVRLLVSSTWAKEPRSRAARPTTATKSSRKTRFPWSTPRSLSLRGKIRPEVDYHTKRAPRAQSIGIGGANLESSWQGSKHAREGNQNL
jgi:hypothetical protein